MTEEKTRKILFFKKIPGQAGVDFPVLASVPDTGFDCGGQEFPGIYGDTGADCQVIFVEIIPKKNVFGHLFSFKNQLI